MRVAIEEILYLQSDSIKFFDIHFSKWFEEGFNTRTILFSSPSNGGFFLPFFQASFNMHVGPTRHLRRKRL